MNYIQSIINRVSEYHEGIATTKEINRAKRAWKKIIAMLRSPRNRKSFPTFTTTLTKTWTFRMLVALVSLIPGVICFMGLSCNFAAPLLEKFCEHSGELSSVLSGYAFTVAGFLATIAMFLVKLGGCTYFEHYKKRGSFDDLVFTHVLTLAWLATVFFASIAVRVYPLPWIINVLLSTTLSSLVLIILLTFCVYNLARRATKEY